MLGFFYFKQSICPPDVKRTKCFSAFTPWTHTRAPPWTNCRAYTDCDCLTWNRTFENSIFVQKRTLAKCLDECLLSACKNHWINLLGSLNHMWDAPDFKVPYDLKGLIPIFDHAHPIKKISSFISSIFWDTADFRAPWSKMPCPILTTTN